MLGPELGCTPAGSPRMLPAIMALLVLAQFNGPASDAEKTAASKSYMECLLTAAESMDDGISDAGGVALGIEGSCASELERLKEVYGRGTNPNLQLMIRERFNQE